MSSSCNLSHVPITKPRSQFRKYWGVRNGWAQQTFRWLNHSCNKYCSNQGGRESSILIRWTDTKHKQNTEVRASNFSQKFSHFVGLKFKLYLPPWFKKFVFCLKACKLNNWTILRVMFVHWNLGRIRAYPEPSHILLILYIALVATLE